MVFNVRLLIVEDDATERDSWNHMLEIHNSQSEEIGFTLSPDYAKSKDEALQMIGERDYDAAVVDIRLEQGAAVGTNADGNFVVEKLLKSELAVVAVFTGEAAEVRIPTWAKPLVQTFRKGGDEGEGTEAVMEWLIKHAPMVQPIRRAQLTIKNEMVKLFTKSIWPRWSQWTSQAMGGDNQYLELALSRHLASHVHAALLESSNQKAHPEEWYFIPPIRDGLRTGDLIEDAAGDVEIVITPRCDLAIANKTETIMLAKCTSVHAEWNTRCNKITTAKTALSEEQDANKKTSLQTKVLEAEESLRRYTQHSGAKASVHFLPSMQLSDGTKAGPFMVQFDNIRSIGKSNKAEIAEVVSKRMASLTSEFLPSLVERLGGYFSRIGTPDYSHEN